MSWTFTNSEQDNASTLATTSVMTVDAAQTGSLRIVFVSWETDVTIVTVRDTSNNDFTAVTPRVAQGGKFAQMWYRFGGDTVTFSYTVTFSSTGATWRDCEMLEFTHDGTGAYDTTPTNGGSSGTTTPAVSGNLTAATANLLAVYGVRTNSGLGGSAGTINSVTATEVPNASTISVMGYRVDVTGPFTGQASRPVTTGQDWICLLATFKEGVSVPALTLTLAEPVIGTSFF